MWAIYSNEPYPEPPNWPNASPTYIANASAAENMAARDAWQLMMKNWEEDMNMNKGLTMRFLSLISAEYRIAYNNSITDEPNKRFIDTLQFFYDQYGIQDEAEIEQNRESMKQPWNINQGFALLKNRMDDGMAYASFAKQTLEASDVLNMFLTVIVATGLFQTQYEEWHALPEDEKTLANAFIWWDKKVRIKARFTKTAATMGRGPHYGMNAQGQLEEHQPAEDAQYEGLVEEFARGQAEAQGAMNNLANGIPQVLEQMQHQSMAMQQMQQQMAMNAQAMAMQQQPAWQQQRQQPAQQSSNNRGRRNFSNNRRNGGTNGANNQPRWNNTGTNTGRNNNSGTQGARWSRMNFPSNVRDDDIPFYCWSHGHDKNHNSGDCQRRCTGHRNNATTHIGTDGNPAGANRTVTPASMGLIGRSRWNAGQRGGQQQATQQGSRQPHWSNQQQANMGMGMPMMQPTQWQQPMQMQPQQSQFAGMAMPAQQFFMNGSQQPNNGMNMGAPMGRNF